MGIALKIAWRYLWRHKGKSLIIGIILFFGSFLMTVGNGVISGMEQGLSKNIVNLFTGDIVVISDKQSKSDVLYDTMSGKPIKVIKNFGAVQKVIENQSFIREYLPATAGVVFILASETEMEQIMLLGVDIERYRKMFPQSFEVIEGRILEPGARGLLLSEDIRKRVYNLMNFWTLPTGVKLNKDKLPAGALENLSELQIRRDIVLMGAGISNSTMDIRVPITGIIKYKALNSIWGYYSIVDIESFREANNYITGADTAIEISDETKQLLEGDQLDQLFSSEGMVDNSGGSFEEISAQEIQNLTQKTGPKNDVDAGSYNLAFLKIKPGTSSKSALNSLNKIFQKNHIGARAITWRDAMGFYGNMAFLIKSALNLFIIFIFFVAIIVIINTLTMTTLERVTEMGMMRAIGTQKGFLQKMYIYETGILSFLFGGLGIIAGIVFIYLLNAAGFTTANGYLQFVYGGSKFSPIFTLGDFLMGIIGLGIVTLLSVLYPLRIVGKIVPLNAITRD